MLCQIHPDEAGDRRAAFALQLRSPRDEAGRHRCPAVAPLKGFGRRLRAALPAEPRWLPDPALSEIVHSLVAKSLKSTLTQPPGTFSALAGLMRAAGGNRRRWRLK